MNELLLFTHHNYVVALNNVTMNNEVAFSHIRLLIINAEMSCNSKKKKYIPLSLDTERKLRNMRATEIKKISYNLLKSKN